MLPLRRRMGFVFQGAALFDSLTVFENVAYPLREHTSLREAEITDRVHQSLSMVGLGPEVARAAARASCRAACASAWASRAR